MRERDPSISVPFSLRLKFEERVQLENDAGTMSLGGYVRSKLFDSTNLPVRRRAKSRVKDHKVLGQVLGQLGQSRLSSNLNQIARALNMGTLDVTPEVASQIVEAAQDIKAIRTMLIAALDLWEGPE